ncbi:MAG TPA: hypothetical protein VKS24_00320 [Bradyrhizobium sp.]|nr:hypothetical protein [Bradyrhizobium sp.]
MFEIGIFCVIALAVGYWAVLWLMERHDDVLHGDFVHPEHGSEPASAPLPPARAENTDTLQKLLDSIKRDLKDAAQL